MMARHEVVTLDYNDLIANKDLGFQIEKAYGEDGLGLLTVKNVPNMEALRDRLLKSGRQLAYLDPGVLAKYAHPESKFSFGWSRGAETLQDGIADVSKGSFYANPQYDRPIEDETLVAEQPAFYHPNIWPESDLPELGDNFKAMGGLMCEVGQLVAAQCDKYVSSQVSSYPPHALAAMIAKSKAAKGRLLNYYPLNNAAAAASGERKQGSDGATDGSMDESEFSSWCGWHNDHGSLTALLSAMYTNEAGDVVENDDKTAGLYIRSRCSELVHVNIPRNHIAFQIGEAAQIQSGGYLQATPHAVRGSKIPGVNRTTFAVFMQPDSWDPISCPAGIDPAQAQSQSAARNLPRGVTPLAERYRVGMTFGDFAGATLEKMYPLM